MMSMMCGGCGEYGNRRAARRMRNHERTSPTNHQQQQHHYTAMDSAAVFREEQTDLLDVFHRHQFDLLTGNPPSHNPDFVGNPPSHNPDFVPRRVSNERPSVFDDAFAALDAEEAASRHRRQGSNNPFEDDAAPSNPFEASVLGASHEYFSQNRAASQVPIASEIPMASAVAISDDDDSEMEIPFVSALRIDEDEEMEAPHSTRSAPIPTSPQNLGPASRVAHPEVQPPRRFSDSQVRPFPNQIPPWLDVEQVAIDQRRASNARANANAAPRRCGNKRPGSWSRLSVQARAAAEETKRSLKKKIGRETKQVKKSLVKEANSVKKSLAKDMRQLSRSMREVEQMLTYPRCHRR